MSVVTYGPRAANDWYVEPAWCVHALFDAEPFEGAIYDPACGGGTIVRCARSRGMTATGSDIANRWDGAYWFDFLSRVDRPEADNIVCNPPYKQALEFIRMALAMTRRKVAVIVQQQFPYSQGRYSLFTETPPAKLYFLSSRPSMPPGDLLRDGKIEAKGGSVDYLWMVWDKAHKGPPTAHWLLRPGSQTEQ